MANVLFKRGQQATLDAQGFQAQDGVFYLTQDTNRLYIGEGTNLKLLNQTVQIVATLNELVTLSNSWNEQQKAAHTYDFYYVTTSGVNNVAGNILVVWNGTEWVQINPDTNTTLSAVAFSSSAASNVASMQMQTTDSKGAHTQDTFTITAAGGLTAAASGKNITLTGETYSLGKSVTDETHATISLNAASGGTPSTIGLEGGDNVTLESTATGIKVIAKDTKNASAALTMPADGSLKIQVNDNKSGKVENTLSNVGIAVGAGTGNVGSYYVPITNTTGKTAANIYTAEEIDGLLNGLDGMTFKGSFSSNGTVNTLPTTGVRNGDVYIIAENGLTSDDIPGEDSSLDVMDASGTRIGDLVIATGTEGSDGYISSGLKWVYVPSGNDSSDAYSYHAEATAATNTLLLKNQISGAAPVAQLSLTGGTDISVTSTASNGALASTISHATYNAVTPVEASSPTGTAASFTAIKELTLSNGHITGITTDTFTPLVYNLTGSTVAEGTRFGNSSTTNDITATIDLRDTSNGQHGNASIKLSSSSITFSKGAANEVVADLVWGTF